MYSKTTKSAFTLIELLVVLSIILLLLSILLPCFRRAREHARNLICRYNLKQNYYELSTYAYDYSGSWPKTDSPYHTNQFYKINSSSTHGPIYYLWRSRYLTNPDTWYCPSGIDKAEDNWSETDGVLKPKENSAVSGYQYRMFFAYNWPDVRKAAIQKTRDSELLGYLRPAQHSNLAVWVDAFGFGPPGRQMNHSISNSWNVLFNDSAVKAVQDKKNIIGQLDLAWWQAGDWRIPLADGRKDDCHNVAVLWNFFDTDSWPADDKTSVSDWTKK
jgi:prepilin-type N-terminal cleavage/methylation domain-containing protein